MPEIGFIDLLLFLQVIVAWFESHSTLEIGFAEFLLFLKVILEWYQCHSMPKTRFIEFYYFYMWFQDGFKFIRA